MIVSVFWGILLCSCVYAATVDQFCDPDSCIGRCFEPVNPGANCQCNTACVDFGDCCSDYDSICNSHIGAPWATARCVTDEELKDFGNVLWSLDVNRIPDDDYTVNFNGPELFEYVNEEHFSRITFSRFIDLLDNYIPHTGVEEPPCPVCREEEEAFLDSILSTEVMESTWEFLADRGLASSSLSGFREELKQYWFLPYSRSGGPLDSSGFEHVFVGEIKDNSVSGFHNWIQNYHEEQSGNFVYGSRIDDCQPPQITMRYSWLGYDKSIGGEFLAVSPEAEMALFTLCFVSRPNRMCYVNLDGNDIGIQTWTLANWDPVTVGSSYPTCP